MERATGDCCILNQSKHGPHAHHQNYSWCKECRNVPYGCVPQNKAPEGDFTLLRLLGHLGARCGDGDSPVKKSHHLRLSDGHYRSKRASACPTAAAGSLSSSTSRATCKSLLTANWLGLVLGMVCMIQSWLAHRVLVLSIARACSLQPCLLLAWVSYSWVLAMFCAPAGISTAFSRLSSATDDGFLKAHKLICVRNSSPLAIPAPQKS